MAFSYRFANICGAPYKGGNCAFTPTGDVLLAPVSNHVALLDLINNQCATLPCQNLRNTDHVVLSPEGNVIISIDAQGHALIINAIKGVILHRINFRQRVSDCRYSPCGKFIAVAVGRVLFIWEAPRAELGWQLSKVKECHGHLDRIRSVCWSPNSKFICTASKDTTVRLFSRYPNDKGTLENGSHVLIEDSEDSGSEGSEECDRSCPDVQEREMRRFYPCAFVDHRCGVRGAYFTSDGRRIVTVSDDAALIVWEWVDEADGMSPDQSAAKVIQPSVRRRLVADRLQRQTKRRRRLEATKMQLEVHHDTIGDESLLQDHDSTVINRVKPKSLQNEIDGKPRGDSNGLIYLDGGWRQESKHFANIKTSGKVYRCDFNAARGVLALGFTSGTFSLYECSDMSALYTLSLGASSIDTVVFNPDGEWIAVGCGESSQLIVWEWQSETYIFKQQSHHFGISTVAFSPIGGGVPKAGSRGGTSALPSSEGGLGLGTRSVFATGGYDGKVKIWDTGSGFCFVTFSEHTAPVTGIAFTPQANAVVSSSLDGTVRAFDLSRYRNFRVFSAPIAKGSGTGIAGTVGETSVVQFNSVAVDGSGELIVAGSQSGDFGAYVWSLQTGSLLEVLHGHTSTIVGVCFHPHPSQPGVLATASWDKTVRLWDVFGRANKGGASEPLIHGKDILAVAFDPRGNSKLASSTLGGVINFWNTETADMIGTIEGLRDIHSGRSVGSKFSANNSRGRKNMKNLSDYTGINQNQHFNSIAYSTNGQLLIAGSENSARVCVYDPDSTVLLYHFKLTKNRSFDGVLMELSSKRMTEAGIPIEEFQLSDSDEDDIYGAPRMKERKKKGDFLPGTSVGELSKRKDRLHLWSVAFSSDARHWAAATSHGVYVYTVDMQGGLYSGGGVVGHIGAAKLEQFSPQLLTRNVNVPNILAHLERGNLAKVRKIRASRLEQSCFTFRPHLRD
eukprot:GHVN01042267.1.p1 GENE.GHVN01042267.1~~GHVN01042267.1.p1  ORF type:complete len:979 (+),score=112.31 GHVN01042267.1:66-2939(+)